MRSLLPLRRLERLHRLPDVHRRRRGGAPYRETHYLAIDATAHLRALVLDTPAAAHGFVLKLATYPALGAVSYAHYGQTSDADVASDAAKSLSLARVSTTDAQANLLCYDGSGITLNAARATGLTNPLTAPALLSMHWDGTSYRARIATPSAVVMTYTAPGTGAPSAADRLWIGSASGGSQYQSVIDAISWGWTGAVAPSDAELIALSALSADPRQAAPGKLVEWWSASDYDGSKSVGILGGVECAGTNLDLADLVEVSY